MSNPAVGTYSGPISAIGNNKVSTQPGAILRIIVASSTSGTVAVYDDATGGTTHPVLAAMAVAAGQVIELDTQLLNGLSITLAGTACNITAIYQ